MKKGFTLMEILAVIIIISLLLIISIPTLLDVVSTRRGETFLMNAKVLAQTISIYKEDYPNFEVGNINTENIEHEIGVKNEYYESISVEFINNEIFITVIGKNDGEWQKYKACGFSYNMELISLENNIRCDELKNEIYNKVVANPPELATGMSPIKYEVKDNEYGWFVTKPHDLNWYNYESKKWANARTQDGSFWVWIPRFAYKINSGYHSSSAGTIDIKFLKGNTNISGDGESIKVNGNPQNEYVLHPAFTFGNTELTGIWVAKFEASAGLGDCFETQSETRCNVTTHTPTIKPNMYSWRNISIKNIYTVIQRMTEPNNKYGFYEGNIDIHLMKNIEWGAVAYLSKSSYGKGTDEIWINPCNKYITGCNGSSVSSGQTNDCPYSYDNSASGINASTTKNIWGIYDMSGGAYEITMSNLNNGGNIFDIEKINKKYKNIYTGYNNNLYGDAIYETSSSSSGNSSWHSDQSIFPDATNPYFIRGGMYNSSSNAGIFAFNRTNGLPNDSIGFRPVIVVLK